MKKSKRLLSLLLAMCMIVGMMSMAAFAADDDSETSARAISVERNIYGYIVDEEDNQVPVYSPEEVYGDNELQAIATETVWYCYHCSIDALNQAAYDLIWQDVAEAAAKAAYNAAEEAVYDAAYDYFYDAAYDDAYDSYFDPAYNDVYDETLEALEVNYSSASDDQKAAAHNAGMEAGEQAVADHEEDIAAKAAKAANEGMTTYADEIAEAAAKAAAESAEEAYAEAAENAQGDAFVDIRNLTAGDYIGYADGGHDKTKKEYANEDCIVAYYYEAADVDNIAKADLYWVEISSEKLYEAVEGKVAPLADIEGEEATCTTDGIEACKYCPVCGSAYDEDGYLIPAGGVIKANGHVYTVVPSVAATDSYNGLSAAIFCSVCGQSLMGDAQYDACGRLMLLELEQTDYCPSEPFYDVDQDAWYHADVDFVIEMGIMKGTDENTPTFEPDTTLSRAMVAQMIYNMAGNPENDEDAEMPYTDAEADTWYTDAVLWAAEAGIADVTEGEFRPDEDITREETVVMIYNYAKSIGVADEMTTEEAKAVLAKYSDVGEVSDDALAAYAWCVENKVIIGRAEVSIYNPTLTPDGYSSRAEAAAIFARFCEVIADEQVVGVPLSAFKWVN